MSLSALPSVLAQSIAHFLTTKERLAMARCSRRSQILAEAPIAWLSADPLTIIVDAGVDCAPLPSGPLLRFIPISFVWTGPCVRDSAVRLRIFAERAHAVALTTNLPGRFAETIVSEMLEDPSLQRLESLTLLRHSRRLIRLACKLPLSVSLTFWSPLSAAEAALLSAAPSDQSDSLPTPPWLCALSAAMFQAALPGSV